MGAVPYQGGFLSLGQFAERAEESTTFIRKKGLQAEAQLSYFVLCFFFSMLEGIPLKTF